MILTKPSSAGLKEIAMTRRCAHDIWFRANLKPGHYVLYIETPWRSIANEVGISIYGPGNVEMETVKGKFKPSFIADLLTQKALLDSTPFKKISQINYKFSLDAQGFGYFYLENTSTTQIYEITVEVEQPMVNCMFLPPFEGKVPQLCLLPRQNTIIPLARFGGDKLVFNYQLLVLPVAKAVTFT